MALPSSGLPTPMPSGEKPAGGFRLLDMNGYQWTVLFAAWLGWGFDVFDGLLFNYVAPNAVPRPHASSESITRGTRFSDLGRRPKVLCDEATSRRAAEGAVRSASAPG